MRKFECKACEHKEVKVKHSSTLTSLGISPKPEDKDKLQLTCNRCGYEWTEKSSYQKGAK